MSNTDGFVVMDIAVDIVNDAKFKRLARLHPELFPTAFTSYMAVLGESWKDGRKAAIEDAWPAQVPFSDSVVTALQEVGLLDKKGQVQSRAWSRWFLEAFKRREATRERWRRANAHRSGPPPEGGESRTKTRASTATLPPQIPRGTDAAPARIQGRSRPSVLSVPSRGAAQAPARARDDQPNGSAPPAMPPITEVIDYLEKRSGRPYAYGMGSRVESTLTADVRDFGAPAVLDAMSGVEIDHPDIAQLVFGASRTLHPLTAPAPAPEPDPEVVRAQLRQRRAGQGAISG